MDNFDVLEDRQAGGGSVNTTHLVAFQNQSEVAVVNKNLVSTSVKNVESSSSKTWTYEQYQLTGKKSHFQHLGQNKVQQMKLALAARLFSGCILEKSTLLISRSLFSKNSSSDGDKNHTKQFQELLIHSSDQLILKSQSIKQFNNICIIYNVLQSKPTYNLWI